MSKKYYTPTIEEFRVGFEYEQVSINPQEDITVSDEVKYEECKFPDPFVGYNLNRLVLNMCRVKYLDKQDIESLGFIEITEDTFEKRKTGDPLVTYSIDYFQIDNSDKVFLRIGQDVLSYEDILFQGSVKNLSELTTLLKQIGIS
jgi:hypothetical protein